MWQIKYASAVPKNLGLGLNFQPCSAVKAISSLGVRSPWCRVCVSEPLVNYNINFRRKKIMYSFLMGNICSLEACLLIKCFECNFKYNLESNLIWKICIPFPENLWPHFAREDPFWPAHPILRGAIFCLVLGWWREQQGKIVFEGTFMWPVINSSVIIGQFFYRICSPV